MKHVFRPLLLSLVVVSARIFSLLKFLSGRDLQQMKLMEKCFSFTTQRDRLYRYHFYFSGLRSAITDFGDGTVMHCWVPKSQRPNKPNLLLLHGFGANTMWQYGDLLRHFVNRFNVFLPDLLFFGGSRTARLERSESFQAQCVMRLMNEAHGVERMSLVGISYGGFVGYSLAAQFPEAVEKVVLCCAGLCLEEDDMGGGLFPVADLDEAASILLPQTPDKLRELMRLSFARTPLRVPSYFLSDYIRVRFVDLNPSDSSGNPDLRWNMGSSHLQYLNLSKVFPNIKANHP